MEIELQVSFDREGSGQPENVFIKDVITSETNHVATNQPAKKQTRKWAAWTRQEEESFFTALRQVGKNFEKITSRVQSKNKDQVRHYYYRLVRRMNKLLGPELSLDAKNSKDTNAAMLRWWSLLEKHSCKASKLHLKPRRFKIFLEALENQLLKDQKKNMRKRLMQGENGSTVPSHADSNQGRASGHDAHIKMVLVDSQNIQKNGSGKGSSLRRNASTGVERNNCKGDSSPFKPPRQRRRPGTASTAAYKRWEKAAIAGVSLVADAAEHLERTALDKLVDSVQDTQGDKGLDSGATEMHRVPAFQQNMFSENNIQPLVKLKLQLFPIDESTRRALEMDNHNPHLELTLSTRKRISSVFERMNRKWGSSSIAFGELTLLPYYSQSLNPASCQKWTQDSVLSAGDIYLAIGSPQVFRLRYGWFVNADFRSMPLQEPRGTSLGKVTSQGGFSSDDPDKVTECRNVSTNKKDFKSPDHASYIPWQRRDMSDGACGKQLGHTGKESCKSTTLSTLEWADSLTNISVGDLLSEASHNIDANCIDSPCLQPVPFSCDSFDAAIAAHINKHHSKSALQPTILSSIWDAEETCDAFSFPKHNVHSETVQTSKEIFKQEAAMSLVPSSSVVEKLPEVEVPIDEYPAEVVPIVECQSSGNPDDGSAKDIGTLTDIYWPDSLGPLDLDTPSCRYHNDDFILSDSLGGLNRLITNSLDSFQNCSLFGLEKKEPASTAAVGTWGSSFADYKIDNGV